MSPPSNSIIHASAPLRINDIGGWTDTWFAGEGRVVNLAVSLRARADIHISDNQEKRADRVLIRALDFDESFRMDPDNPDYSLHPLLQGAVNSIPILEDIDLKIEVGSDAPPGSALGTSAAVSVALIGGLARMVGRVPSLDGIVSLAHRAETEKVGLQSGIQDQIAAAYGGICSIHMTRYPEAEVETLDLEPDLLTELEQRLCLVYLGRGHSSSYVHNEVIASLERRGSIYDQIEKMRDLAGRARECLLNGDLEFYGRLMCRTTDCHRALHPALVSPDADRIIGIAGKHGASGWKVNGAGGDGGSITLLAGSPDPTGIAEMLCEIESLGGGIHSLIFKLEPVGFYCT